MKRLLVVLLSVIVFTFLLQTNISVAYEVFFGCMHKQYGKLRIVKNQNDCKITESSISWNKLGPQGEQGIAGINAPCDKQIRLSITNSVNGVNSIIGEISDRAFIRKFKSDNYADIKSIIFSAKITTTDPSSNCLVDLYNLTDDEPIPNSLIQSTNLNGEFVESDNIIDDFPDTEIDIAIRIRSEIDGVWVNIHSAEIYLYRDCSN